MFPLANKYKMQIERMDKMRRLVWNEYDVTKVKEALIKSSGAFRDIDTIALLLDIREERKQNDRRRPPL